MPTIDKIEDALKKRISNDVGSVFNPSIWKDIPFINYYGNDDEVVNVVVYETTEGVVKSEGKTLPDNVWKALIAAVSPATLPKNAINTMWLASIRAVPVVTSKNRPSMELLVESRKVKGG